ncbi:MAG: PorT family protein [Bacteroidetes bacterium]|nr:PorT family protein [Bacteroidota bacterium]
MVAAALTPLKSQAQLSSQPLNLPKYDYQPIHFGFLIGLNSADFRIKKVADFNLLDSVYFIESGPVAGINLGILSNLRIGRHFDLRFLPTLSFDQRNLTYGLVYRDSASANTVKRIESTYLEFPILLKFKSDRVNNYRAYVIAGFKYGIDMVSQAKVRQLDKDIVKLKRNDYGYEIGFGFDFYLTYFKFSPEIKMYTGLRNLLSPDSAIYSTPIESLSAKTFTISLCFE